jgi:hypothetical protein
MKRSYVVIGLVAALCAQWPRPCAAGIPSASTSFVASHIVVCPAGDSAVVVIARHVSFSPWSEGPIVLDFCGCPGIQVVIEDGGCVTLEPGACSISTLPDLMGEVQLAVAGGGTCPGGVVKVLAGGILLGIRGEPASFDQDGNLVVDANDVAIVTSKLGSSSPGADFDGDGTVTAADLAIIQLHMGHHAAGVAPPASPAPIFRTGAPGR